MTLNINGNKHDSLAMNVVSSAGEVVISKQQTNEQIQSQQPN